MHEFLELTLAPQRDSFGEKRRHFDLVAANRISLKLDENGLPFTGTFVHRQTKQNPYSRAQALVVQIDTSYYHDRGISYSQLGPNKQLFLYENSQKPAVATAFVTRRWWEPTVRQDFPQLEPLPINDRFPIDVMTQTFAPHEIAWVYLGQQPKSQEDRWIVYSQRPWVYLYRSWTKLPVFAFAFGGDQIKEAYVFSAALKEGIAPESMASNLTSWLRQVVQQANDVLDSPEAKLALIRGR